MATEGLYQEFLEMDGEARDLLGAFYEWMKSAEGPGMTPEEASPLAFEADRYLRYFLIEIMETGVSTTNSVQVVRYLSNWYIINTLYPTIGEMDKIASSLSILHEYLSLRGIIPQETSEKVKEELSDLSRYHNRLDEFFELSPENVAKWRLVDDYRENPQAGNCSVIQ